MLSYIITPEVDAIREFLEIAGDFTNPLEMVREGVSNSMDAGATQVSIAFTAAVINGKRAVEVRIADNGSGMDESLLKSFFDLGNSHKRGDPNLIGEKGHGTKVFFNCSQLVVTTTKEGRTLRATMQEPMSSLHAGNLPQVLVSELPPAEMPGTEVHIQGFNGNDGELFTHERLKDYIKWFTKFGSVEREFGIEVYNSTSLKLTGLDRHIEPETLSFGHFFPVSSKPIKELFDEHIVRAPDFYCKKIIREGSLTKHPDISYQAVFCIEGNKVKQMYNPMLRHQGYQAPRGAYTVQERYGVWLCKDFIPIERKNDWVSLKGSEFTKFHAFFNCQDLSLTANRGSTANTPTAVMEDIRNTVREIYDNITSSDDWRDMDWLESEAVAHNSQQKEQKDFTWRKARANATNIASLKNVTLVQPVRESGVYALLVQLSILGPDLFPFTVVDYETYAGIDLIAKTRGTVALSDSALYYVELKHTLSNEMNHSFANMKSIVCWDTALKHGEKISDLAGDERELAIIQPDDQNKYTGYYLRRDRKTEIEVFVLKDYLREKLGLEFRPRTQVEADAKG